MDTSNRVTITDLPNGLEVTVFPFPKPIVWLHAVVYLAFFGVFSYYIFFDGSSPPPTHDRTFYIVIAMYCIMAYAVLSTGYAIWWLMRGKEIITVSNGMLTIDKINSIEKTRKYDLALAANFRAVEEEMRRGRNFGRIEGYAWQLAVKGTIKFDYDVVNVIKFGDWLSEDEGAYIIQRLKDKKLIS